MLSIYFIAFKQSKKYACIFNSVRVLTLNRSCEIKFKTLFTASAFNCQPLYVEHIEGFGFQQMLWILVKNMIYLFVYGILIWLF